MPSRKEQIKQQMAQAQDPLVRMQLDALLNAESKRRGDILRKIEDTLDSLLGPRISRWPPGALGVLFLLVLTIVLFAIIMVLECTATP